MNADDSESDPLDPKLSEDRRKHLDFIAASIIRMAACSFQLKGWSVTIVAAILAVTATTQNMNRLLPLTGLIPTVIFWALDAYYLRLEKLFREMHNDASQKDSKLLYYDMNPHQYSKSVPSIIPLMFSKSVAPLHLVLFGILVAVAVAATP